MHWKQAYMYQRFYDNRAHGKVHLYETELLTYWPTSFLAGLCDKKQKEIARAIRRARAMGISYSSLFVCFS